MTVDFSLSARKAIDAYSFWQKLYKVQVWLRLSHSIVFGGDARCGAAGRQGVLGLAISLVATVPEKVWYCSVKGYSPWERPKPADVRTREDGGHTIWYDEPQLMKVS